jgi:hypothetical protein
MAEDSKKDGQPHESPGPLRFVNLDRSNLGRDPSTKKIVRSHVMQRYRRGKAMKTPSPNPSPPVWNETKDRKPTESPRDVLEEVLGRLEKAGYSCQCLLSRPGPARRRSSLGTPLSETTPVDDKCSKPLFTVCPKCGGCIRASTQVSPNLTRTILGAGKTDPFNTLPLNDQTQSFYLLDHCTLLLFFRHIA